MPTYRRQIRIPLSKLPVRLTPYRTINSAVASRRPAGRIASAPRRLTAAPAPGQTAASDIAVSLTLPVPPSINHQYATVNGRRLLSSAGRAYKAQVGQLVWLNLAASPDRSMLLAGLQSASLALSIRFYFTSALRRDVDGGLKIAQDALCEGLGINDNRIVETHLYKHVDKANPRIEVRLTMATQS
jgi:crossover junction endodeoxyribonuclease RusA